MSLDPKRNFAVVTLTTGYSAGATSVSLITNDGGKLPAPASEGAFNLVWWNATDYAVPSLDPNVEIVRCTARSGDVLTITRAQESTAATAKNTANKTYRMSLGFTKKDMDDINAALLTGSSTPIYADSGSANALEITTGQGLTALTDGMRFTVRPANTITSNTVTLTVDSVAAKNVYIKAKDDNNLAQPVYGPTTGISDIMSGIPMTFVYDATQGQFYIDSPVFDSAEIAKQRFVFCLNNSVDPDTIILEKQAGIYGNSPEDGEMLAFIANGDNTGEVTLETQNYSPDAVLRRGGVPLSAGDILDGDFCIVARAGSFWALVSSGAIRGGTWYVNNAHGEISMASGAATTLTTLNIWYKISGTTVMRHPMGYDDDSGSNNRLRYAMDETALTHSGCTLSVVASGNNGTVAMSMVRRTPLPTDPITTTNTTTQTITKVNHGLLTGDIVSIAGITGPIDGIAASEFNTTKTITKVNDDQFTITTTSSGSVGGVTGGGSAGFLHCIPKSSIVIQKFATAGDTLSTAIHVMYDLEPDDCLELWASPADATMAGQSVTVNYMNIFSMGFVDHVNG